VSRRCPCTGRTCPNAASPGVNPWNLGKGLPGRSRDRPAAGEGSGHTPRHDDAGARRWCRPGGWQVPMEEDLLRGRYLVCRGESTPLGPGCGPQRAVIPSSLAGQAAWRRSRLACGRTRTLDLTGCRGAHSVLVAPGGRNAGRRDGPGEPPGSRCPELRACRVTRWVGILVVREVPRASKVLRNRVDTGEDSEYSG